MMPNRVFNRSSEKYAVIVPVAVIVVAATVPPERFVAVVAVAALPVQEAEEPVVELEVVALPDNAAVIVPAEKFPEASRSTIVEAVLAVAAVMVALFA